MGLQEAQNGWDTEDWRLRRFLEIPPEPLSRSNPPHGSNPRCLEEPLDVRHKFKTFPGGQHEILDSVFPSGVFGMFLAWGVIDPPPTVPTFGGPT